MENFTKIQEILAAAEADANKFYNSGNAAAGTRTRKAMLDVRKLAQAIRIEIQGQKNSK